MFKSMSIKHLISFTLWEAGHIEVGRGGGGEEEGGLVQWGGYHVFIPLGEWDLVVEWLLTKPLCHINVFHQGSPAVQSPSPSDSALNKAQGRGDRGQKGRGKKGEKGEGDSPEWRLR